ncbi:hypothetical protein [Bacillus toyonensis]|uniref:hypothetical protein n=1 Tax=Bacillus toyonensis TaxID=155322 RepID=UPI001C0E431B|nr:hypothetical protein [Bacillus toyonensis]MBU4640091.1 hypothetical protein [Bacillus toyonensis]
MSHYEMGLETASIWLSLDIEHGKITDNYRDNSFCRDLNEQELKWVVKRAKERLKESETE